MTDITRRRLLGAAGAVGMCSAAGVLGAMTNARAYAADLTGYKALVCLFLYGGMDHADAILPYDQAGYDTFFDQRESLLNRYGGTRSRDNLLPLEAANADAFEGRAFAMPPEFAPLRDMFDDGDLAWVGNVGPLIEPTTKSTMDNNTVQLPPRLFSHNDQQSTWMALNVEGSRYGWGGRFADAVLAASSSQNPTFTAISTNSQSVWLSGQNVRQFQLAEGGPRDFDLLERLWMLGYHDAAYAARDRIRAYYADDQANSSNYFTRDIVAAKSRAVANNEAYKVAEDMALDITTEFPNTNLGGQLRTVADAISIQEFLGVSRQIFFVGIGGFDTHSGQSGSLPGRQTEIAGAVAAFRNAMIEIGKWNEVTLFSATEFGRTVVDNGDGTDHGWGGHQFVAGGAVNGRRIYGAMPDQDLDGERYTDDRGRLIPDVSVDQFAGTLGSWFGLDTGELNDALPNLSNFDERNLGFV